MPKRKKRPPQVQLAESDSEYDDEISSFHKERDKILLDSDQGVSDETEEEEVYPLVEEEESDEEIAQMQQQLRQIRRNKVKQKMDSDMEMDDEDEGVPDSRAWGSKQSWFMGGDVRDNKIILSGSEDEAGAAVLEEKECLEIEKRRLARMREEDYMPHFLKKKKKADKEKNKKDTKKEKDEEQKDVTLVKPKSKKKKQEPKEEVRKEFDEDDSPHELESDGDLEKIPTKLTKEEEFEKNKRLYPEYIPLVNDFRAKMKEMKERIIPLMGLVKGGKIVGLGKTYIRMKYHVISNYLVCGGFYMYLMAKRTPRLHHHPVMKRLLEFQQFYNRLVPLDQRVKMDLDAVLKKIQNGEEIDNILGDAPDSAVTKEANMKKRKLRQDDIPKKKRKIQTRHGDGLEEEDDEEEDEEDGQLPTPLDAEGDGDADGEERRAITYQMEKNRGLTAYKKKELKNPRVKHRTKFRRAVIRRKGQVREFKPHKTSYTGEITGIRAGIIRSRKLK